MSEINQIHLSTAGNYGKQAGFLASRCRDKKLQQRQIEGLLAQWKQIFSLSDVVFLGLATLALIGVDIMLMMPLYLQTAQVIEFGNPEILKYPVGIGVNILAIVASEKLGKCFDSGSFQKWELWKRNTKADAMAQYDSEMSRSQRILQFLLAFSLYLVFILMMFWIRAILINKSDTDIEKVELQVSVMGICISLVTVLIGMYVLPFFQYLFWSGRAHLTNWQIHFLSRRVAQLDGYIHLFWRHNGAPSDITKDLREALIRHTFRTKDAGYCDAITLQENESFDALLHLLKTAGNNVPKTIDRNID